MSLLVDFTSAASILSTAFSIAIALQAYSVYRKTEREQLLSLSIAFVLLAISYVLLIPLAFGIMVPTIGYVTGDILAYPPRIVVASIAYVIIALSYTRTIRARQILYGLIALLVFSVVLTLVPWIPSVPDSVDVLLFLLHAALLSYVLYRMWQVAKTVGLVFSAFLILLASQFVTLIYIFQMVDVTFMFAQTLRVISFVLLFVALLRSSRPRAIVKKPVQDQGGASS